jgi:hypothetical protein
MEDQIIEILNDTDALLRRNGPRRWTRGVAARDANGNSVPVHSDAAAQWGVLGCVMRVAAEKHASPKAVKDAVIALTSAAREMGYRWLDDVKGYYMARAVVEEACGRGCGRGHGRLRLVG